ncbi:Fe-S cluster assembly protein SufD [Nostoc sp. 'Lobaria pulmonaria (5183) cyanobiont']|uniref:Fe-S cluster assembly protein SufD n=1 Tax=Nostoc sp. 'Lobaria pulmonaria (5183) cyanobiont' TaxID=1618022 RepID=UPI000CF322A4|nr:Fe-S cluster assembly protein SufD [Nostoc sp. 'Lobaria pulmonaria (5183) cyanobiont']AVH71759.1 Iron-regulated ABC transporter permease protein SufD [Nostoc sp. 'Lobaria pulmonaria (5183) cyanobiont']
MSIQVSQNQASNTLVNGDPYLSELLNQFQGLIFEEVPQPETFAWLQQVRDRAANFVRHSTIPTTREEEWRFTDLSSLRQVKFNVETRGFWSIKFDITQLTLPEAVDSRLVFVNGVFAPDLSSVADLPEGIWVEDLAEFPLEYRDRLQNYLAQQEGTQEVFTALNTAAFTNASVVWVGKNVVVETPIHLLFLSIPGNSPILSQPRSLVVAESGSSVTLIEDYLYQPTNIEDPDQIQLGEVVHFTNAVTEIWVEENAQVNHTRIQRESAEAFHIGKTSVSQARDSRYTCNAINLGAKLSRHNLEILQTGEQTETTLNGLTMISSKQLSDTHSAIALNHPHGTTDQLHKCIVGDRAHAVFNGKVFVPKLAQLTNAAQLNRNLLLSSKARVDTKPQLEITADNVKCAHGATVSQLEDDEIFYLQSRGIDENDARKLLVNAFAAEVINKIPIPSLREILLNIVNNLKSISPDS